MEENTPALIAGTAGGTHVADGPLTTSLMREGAPELLRNEVDRRIVTIRPMATPVDQISRMVGARPSNSMIVDYYSVDTKPGSVTVRSLEPLDDESFGDYPAYLLKTDNDKAISPTETLLAPSVDGYAPDGRQRKSMLVLYVVERGANNEGLKVLATNGRTSGSSQHTIPSLTAGSTLIRMGRAAAELDVQTAQFEALPRKATNYCQIFKAQVEQSTYARIAAKEVGWTFSDQEEVAIMDMRLGMERSFLFGAQARIPDQLRGDEVMLTGGIWYQATEDFNYDPDEFTFDTLVSLMRRAFTGENSGSSRKIFLAGSDLIEKMTTMEYTKTVSAGETVTRWGIDFNEIRSKFGSLYVIHSEIFDNCLAPGYGMIIDPEYLTKYTHMPFRVEHLDLKKSGVRNTDAIVVTEASCLVLRHPKAHIRVIPS